ncbi:hypothetical protein Tco_0272165 [Tanacetum coccineum]
MCSSLALHFLFPSWITRSGSTTTHANNSLPEYDSFLLELPEFESFHFDLYDDPLFPRPPPEPPDVEISLIVETNAPVINNVGEINVEDDDSFTFVIQTFLPFLTYPKVSHLLSSTQNEDTIFDPGLNQQFLKLLVNGYIKNHKKTVKKGQALTREQKSVQKPDKSVISKLLVAHSHEEATSEQEKHKGEVGFTLGSLREVTQGKRGWDTKIPQSGGPLIKVGDEAVHKELDDRMERAATTASSLEVEQTDFCYVSLIHQFWETASATTNQNGEMEITATIDGRLKTVTEASIRRHLKLEDSAGINSLPNAEIFEQLALMGYVSDSDSLTFLKGHFSRQ